MREILIRIVPPPSKQIDEEDDYQEVWPTMLPDDEGVLPKIKATFFDAATFRPNPDIAPHLYNVISDWSAPIEEKAVHSFSINGGCADFNNYHTNFHEHYIGNDFLVRQEILDREFKDKDTSERWKRMPIHGPGFNPDTNNQEQRDDDKRWPMLSYDYNIRASLKRTFDAEPSFDCSPDLDQDNKTKGRGKVKDVDFTKPLEFDWKSAKLGKYGIKVEETGTKTMAHFLSGILADPNNPGSETANYTVEWLEPFGIFYCPFDTTDSDNIKVTREPRYDADEVDGNFIRVKPKTDIKVFLVPRQWAHYCRVMKSTVSEEPVGQVVFSITSTWNVELNGLVFTPPCLCGFGYIVGTTCAENYCDCWYATEIAYDPGEGGTHTSTMRADIYDRTFDTYIGLWWDRFRFGPYPTLMAGRPQPTEEKGPFTFLWMPTGKTTWDDFIHLPVNLIGDESFDEALQHAIDAGDEEADARKKIIGGFNSFHLYSATPDIDVNVFFDPDDPENSAPTLNLVWRSTPGCNEFPKGETYGKRDQFMDGYNLKNASALHFWNLLVGESEFWQQYGQYSDKANGAAYSNSIPYGMGLSPNKEGSLIGIVLLNDSKPYFVWRRTDEHFEEKLLKVSGDYDGHFLSFEGDANSAADLFFSQGLGLWPGFSSQLTFFSGERRRLDRICRKVSSVGCQANSLANWRYRAADAACWVTEHELAEVELERPVYVVFSREAALLPQTNHHSSPRVIRQLSVVSPEQALGDYYV